MLIISTLMTASWLEYEQPHENIANIYADA